MWKKFWMFVGVVAACATALSRRKRRLPRTETTLPERSPPQRSLELPSASTRPPLVSRSGPEAAATEAAATLESPSAAEAAVAPATDDVCHSRPETPVADSPTADPECASLAEVPPAADGRLDDRGYTAPPQHETDSQAAAARETETAEVIQPALVARSVEPPAVEIAGAICSAAQLQVPVEPANLSEDEPLGPPEPKGAVDHQLCSTAVAHSDPEAASQTSIILAEPSALPIPAAVAGDACLAPGVNDAAGSINSQAPKTAENGAETLLADDIRGPAKYRLRARAAVSRTARAPNRSRSASDRKQLLGIQVRLLFEAGGFCAVALVPERAAGFPENIVVRGPGTAAGQRLQLDLAALEDTWYQDVSPPTLPELLRDGAAWAARVDGRAVRWALSARQLYVLGQRNELSGFVSTIRLVLGMQHAVLCVNDILDRVVGALGEAGAEGFTILPHDFGAPAGWTVIRGVVPKNAVAARPDDELLNPLRPLPGIELSLEGGIRLSLATYLAGFPPRIRLRGSWNQDTEVFIDGVRAATDADGSFTAPGWDAPGIHTVFCHGTRTYSIEEPDVSPDARAGIAEPEVHVIPGSRFQISGALVRQVNSHPTICVPVRVQPDSTLLLGAEPGQVFHCRPGGFGKLCVALPPFDPVWGLPADPLHASKEVARVRVFREAQPARSRPRIAEKDVRAWCNAILDCGRKGLALEPADARSAALWQEYRKLAKAIRRGGR